MKILFCHSDKNLGGRDLDWQILEVVCEEIYEENKDELKESPIKNRKTRLGMLESIEKFRLQLSGDTEATLNLEIGNIDYSEERTRDEFENII